MRINKDDGSFDERLRTDQLIIGGIVYDVEDTNLASTDFGTPREVTTVKAKGTKFFVSSSCANLAHAFFTDTSHGGRSAHFELALFAKLRAATSGLAAFVHSFACDTHG
mmetsp:Transcript_5353/g.10365  ORF Transcript_5353/g.10365 Transcript_5353/m.10365 type:complete len:109 (+) Transcript_5353:207-533(+)